MRGDGKIYEKHGIPGNWYVTIYQRGVGGQRGREVDKSVATFLGKSPRSATRADAVRLLRQLQADRRQGAEYIDPRVTVAQVVDAYAAGQRLRNQKPTHHLEMLKRWLGHRLATSLTLSALTELAAAKEIPRGPWRRSTIATRLGFLRTAMTYAVRAQMIAGVPPFPKLEFDNVRRQVPTMVEVEEICAILAKRDPCYADLYRFLAISGWRGSMALAMTWEMVDREMRVIRLPKSKNGAWTLVYGGDRDLEEIIERRWQSRIRYQTDGTYRMNPAEQVWTRKSGKPVKVWKESFYRARKEAGYPHHCVHDTRRLATVDNIQSSGLTAEQAMERLGFRTTSTLRRYNISEVAHAQRATEHHYAQQAPRRAAARAEAARRAAAKAQLSDGSRVTGAAATGTTAGESSG